MKHHIFEAANEYPIAILMKPTAFNKQDLLKHYVYPLVVAGLKASDMIGFTLDYDEHKKAPVSHIKEYLKNLMPILKENGVKYLYVTDSAFFKVITKQAKAEGHLGYVLPCGLPEFEDMKVILGLNYQQLIYNPELQSKLNQSLEAVSTAMADTYVAPGTGIIHSAYYPESLQDITQALESLHQYPELTADIEAFSLRFNEAGIGTCAFAWDEHNGIAFKCDYKDLNQPIEFSETIIDAGKTKIVKRVGYAISQVNEEVRKLIKQFLSTYKGKITWHNAGYDVKVIVYTLWMKGLLDYKGMLEGIDTLTKNIDDTKIIVYLATNSTAGNVLRLKALAQEFAGNWGIDEIKDIRLIKGPQLLQYNLVDALSTWYVKKKYTPVMIQDQQKKIYDELFIPSIKTILQMELVGMPMNKAKIQEVKGKLEVLRDNHLTIIMNTNVIQTMNLLVQTKAMETANSKLKVKQHPLEKFKDAVFNPASGPQLQRLLYELMGLPVIDLTDSKEPATGAETIEKLINHTQDPVYKEMLTNLIGYNKVSKILSTFIPAFEKAIEKAHDGIVWLHGSLNLGGTVSGRLSSSDPNLQNLPASSLFAKLVKECFQAPEGWIFAGADFNSLEDYISALTTKDPNKLDVYIKGFDGHSLRAAYYFKDELIVEGLNIIITDPKSVNILKETDHPLRQKSKAPTFALTYQGTYFTLMNNLGWTKEFAQKVEGSYHELYKVSDDYIQDRLKQASIDGYVSVAFGLRVRTPLLKQVIYGKNMPYEAGAEGRTAGNAMGQSYGLLNNRAANEFMEKVWASKYRYDILPVVMIHDAIYLLMKEDPEIVEWANRELIASMRWCDLPELYHPIVKIGAALDIFWPSWANKITLPNDIKADEIIRLCQKGKEEYLNPKPKEKK